MNNKTQQHRDTVTIDNHLLLVLFGLQASIGLSISIPEVRRVFEDAASGQLPTEEYKFLQTRRTSLTGHVEASQPQLIVLQLSHRDAAILLPRTVSEAAYWSRLIPIEGMEKLT